MIELQRLDDVELLALLIAGEADDQPLAGQVAVACTVTARKARRRAHYGLTLRTIMLRPGQYSTFNSDHWRNRTTRIGSHIRTAELAVAELLLSPVAGATHYHHKAMAPYPAWAEPVYSVFLGER